MKEGKSNSRRWLKGDKSSEPPSEGIEGATKGAINGAIEEATKEGVESVKKSAAETGKVAKSAVQDTVATPKPISKGFVNIGKSIISSLPGKGVTAAILGIATVATATVLTVNAMKTANAHSPKVPQNTVSPTSVEAGGAAGEMPSDEAGSSMDQETKESGQTSGGSSTESAESGTIAAEPQLNFIADSAVRWIFEMESDSPPHDSACGDGAPYHNWIQFVSYPGSSFTSDPNDQPYVKGQIDKSGEVDIEIILEDEKNMADGCGDYTHLEGKLVGKTIEGTYAGQDCSNYCKWSGTFRVTIGE